MILVNLTCGRNPWKRASPDDSTYAAYTKDPHFLRTILPISADLDLILHRIFEPEPAQRASLPELRQLIQASGLLTTSSVVAQPNIFVPSPQPSSYAISERSSNSSHPSLFDAFSERSSQSSWASATSPVRGSKASHPYSTACVNRRPPSFYQSSTPFSQEKSYPTVGSWYTPTWQPHRSLLQAPTYFWGRMPLIN